MKGATPTTGGLSQLRKTAGLLYGNSAGFLTACFRQIWSEWQNKGFICFISFYLESSTRRISSMQMSSQMLKDLSSSTTDFVNTLRAVHKLKERRLN